LWHLNAKEHFDTIAMLYQRSDHRRLKDLAADQRLTASLRRAESWAATHYER
jgi:hypothetical protein